MRRVAAPLTVLLVSATLVACGKDNPVTEGDATSTQPTTTATTTTAGKPKVERRSAHDGCKAVPAPKPSGDQFRKRSRSRLKTNRTYTVVMRTNCGTIHIRLSSGTWPKTTSAFAGLVRGKFFDGLTFHRIAKPGGTDYVIQGGDPLGTGNGGPGYSLYETPPSTTKYPRYTVAMAKATDERAGTSGSQFFIVTAKKAPLDPDYAVLGTVTTGQDVVRRIARLATDPATEMPVDPVVMSKVTLVSAPRS